MSSYKISIPAATLKRGGGADGGMVPVESYNLGQKVKAAIAAGAFATAGLTVVGWVVLAIASLVLAAPWQAWLAMPGIALTIGVLVASWQGYDWVIKAAIRAWQIDDEERKRRHDLEDAQLEAQEALADAAQNQVLRGDDKDGNPLTLTDEQRLDLVALNMLKRVYLYGELATRDVMTHDGVCTQQEWNLVNAGMKAIGLRTKQTWQSASFGDAFALWCENVRLEETHEGDRYLMVLKQSGKWHALERIE